MIPLFLAACDYSRDTFPAAALYVDIKKGTYQIYKTGKVRICGAIANQCLVSALHFNAMLNRMIREDRGISEMFLGPAPRHTTIRSFRITNIHAAMCTGTEIDVAKLLHLPDSKRNQMEFKAYKKITGLTCKDSENGVTSRVYKSGSIIAMGRCTRTIHAHFNKLLKLIEL